MKEETITLAVVRWDGTTQRTTFIGYLAESCADKAFAEAKNDKKNAFAIVTLSSGGFRHRYVAEPLKRTEP